MKNTVRLLGTLLFCLCFSFTADAAKVAKVKGKKVLINLEGDPAQAGDIYYTLTPEGKKAGIIKLQKIKGDQAIAILGKGRALPGFGLEYRQPKGAAAASTAATDSSSEDPAPSDNITASTGGSNKMYWGGMLGFSQNTMDVDLKDGDGNTRANASLSGSAFSAKGLFDYELLQQVWFRGTAGMEGFKASGGSVCGDSPTFGQACDVDIMYLSMDLWGRYMFTTSTIRPWVGVGFSLLFPMTKKATAVEEGSISNSSVMSLGGGVDWFISKDMYIPIQLEYGILPESEDVKAHLIALRVGLGIPF